MSWRKLGRVYRAAGHTPWAMSHAFLPTPLVRENGAVIRVFSAFLDVRKVGRIGYVDIDAEIPMRVIRVSEQPVLDIGAPGAFDDAGVNPLSIVEHDGKVYLYYVGWQLGIRIRYTLFVGLAISEDGGETFTRQSQVPILDRADGELCVRTASHVIKDGDIWKMWYVAGSDWIQIAGKQVPTYTMRYLESPDGIQWGKRGSECLRFANDDEYGFGRPFVRKTDSGYRMWYSIRSKSRGYRLGYAQSSDGIEWTRMDDQVGIDVAPAGWDSEMMCFASLVDRPGKTYMLYNGNNYGETGFGVAVREGDL